MENDKMAQLVETTTLSSVNFVFGSVVVSFIIFVVSYLFLRNKNNRINRTFLTEQEKEEILSTWNPEPLVPDVPPDHIALNPKYIDGKMTKYVEIDGKSYLNLATYNFLGLVGNKRIEEAAKKTIFKYGVGSCGPRGFYGTVDVHLNLEKQLAQFLNCEDAVLYSYGFATIASAIPAYAKRGDVIFADKGVNFAIQKGLQASRSRIEWFEHNSMNDLECRLMEQEEWDRKNTKLAAKIRRFMVVEGLYVKTGEICPLPKLLELKWKYKVRIFIDESMSFGVIGATGRGVTEHFGVDVLDIDMIMASLEHAVASGGGFCAGRSFVVGHQRLSGLGYCFSASLPPLLASAAAEALVIMEEDKSRFDRLSLNSRTLHYGLEKIFLNTMFIVQGNELSPIQHILCRHNDRSEKERLLDDIVDKMYERSVILTRARYLEKQEAFPVEPSIRVMVQSELSKEELEQFISDLQNVISKM